MTEQEELELIGNLLRFGVWTLHSSTPLMGKCFMEELEARGLKINKIEE